MGIEELKELQKKIIKKNKICNIVGIISFTIISLITIFIILNIQISSSGTVNILRILMMLFYELVIFLFVMVLIKIVVNSGDRAKFNSEFKNIFVLSALKDTFDDLVYNPDKGFDEEKIKSIGMIDTCDRYSSNDYVSGVYKGIKIEQSDVHIEEEEEKEDKDGHKTITWETVFKGRWMIYDFNKNFKANMLIVGSNFYTRIIQRGKNLSKVKMEDVEFNNMFKVFTDIEHDAFYILTPHFMEKIKRLYKELNATAMFCFVDNKLHVAVNNYTDSFEYNALKEINEEEIKKNIIKDIKLITDFVNELNLDNDLFKEDV